jgi:hypothetical protein
MNKLFIDCKTDAEKADFFLSGRAHETGVIAASIQNDVAMAYKRCVSFQDELRRLHEVNQELLKALKAVSHSVKMAQITGNDWRRELALIENVARSALAKATGDTHE